MSILRVGYYTYNHAGSIFQVDLVGIVATGDFALKQFKEWAEAYDHFERLASLLWDIEDKGFPPIKVSSPPSTSAITNRDAREMGIQHSQIKENSMKATLVIYTDKQGFENRFSRIRGCP